MLPPDAPFVLFEDARPKGGKGRLFTAPINEISARTPDEVEPALAALRSALRRGFYVAGWLSYEAGLALEPRLRKCARPIASDGAPLAWFGVFNDVVMLDHGAVASMLPDANGAYISTPRPRVSLDEYASAYRRVHGYIADGDIYQANLSYRADVSIEGEPLAAYAQMREAGQGGWSAVVHHGATWLLSTSPELFFRLSDGQIEARPMKGTAPRHADPEKDRQAARALKMDPKERSENVMIVDLLRNDVSRLAKPGSVNVPELFSVETYPTLHTLTSTVRAQLREECDAVDALRALFPCGSITGAPKIRAMEIISELEADARGGYTGSIGWMGPDGSAEFNVAIRTISMHAGRAQLGLGSAIVFDSNLESEWAECRAKGAFATVNAPHFDLLETLRFEPESGVAYLDLHLARLGASAAALDFMFDAERIRAALAQATECVAQAHTLRLSLTKRGDVRIEMGPVRKFARDIVDVALISAPVSRHDFRLRHKTTHRAFYDDARKAASAEEVIFIDADGFITEGSFTNVFVEREGVLLTPPLARGLLPGVLRAALLASGRAREADLRVEDLRAGFFLGNAARGLARARIGL